MIKMTSLTNHPHVESLKRATKPLQVIINDMIRFDLFKHAYAMAYITIFSLVPSLAAIFALVSLFQPLLGENSSFLTEGKSFIFSHLASGSGEQVVFHIEQFIGNLDIKKIGLTGFAAMIVILIFLLKQIEIALNRVFQVRKARNLITRFIYFWTFLTLGSFTASLSIGLISGFNFANLIGVGAEKVQVGFIAQAFPVIGLFMFFIILYKLVPNCYITLRHAATGSLVSTILLSIVGKFYGLYISTFTSYTAIYGALAAIPVFLFWIYVIWLITLLGSVITRRAQQGFRVDSQLDKQPELLTTREKFRNFQLQSLLVFPILAAIHQKFQDGDGIGINGFELAKKLSLPCAWVMETLELLLNLGLIIASDRSISDIKETMCISYFPSKPAHSLNVTELNALLQKDADNWIKNWKPDWPYTSVEMTKWIKNNHTDIGQDYSLSDLLNAVSKPA